MCIRRDEVLRAVVMDVLSGCLSHGMHDNISRCKEAI